MLTRADDLGGQAVDLLVAPAQAQGLAHSRHSVKIYSLRLTQRLCFQQKDQLAFLSLGG